MNNTVVISLDNVLSMIGNNIQVLADRPAENRSRKDQGYGQAVLSTLTAAPIDSNTWRMPSECFASDKWIITLFFAKTWSVNRLASLRSIPASTSRLTRLSLGQLAHFLF